MTLVLSIRLHYIPDLNWSHLAWHYLCRYFRARGFFNAKEIKKEITSSRGIEDVATRLRPLYCTVLYCTGTPAHSPLYLNADVVYSNTVSSLVFSFSKPASSGSTRVREFAEP
jgi:hypothetical protein